MGHIPHGLDVLLVLDGHIQEQRVNQHLAHGCLSMYRGHRLGSFVIKYSSVIQKLKHVFKAPKVDLTCQNLPVWTGFKAMRAQTLTHGTISLLTDIVFHISEA